MVVLKSDAYGHGIENLLRKAVRYQKKSRNRTPWPVEEVVGSLEQAQMLSRVARWVGEKRGAPCTIGKTSMNMVVFDVSTQGAEAPVRLDDEVVFWARRGAINRSGKYLTARSRGIRRWPRQERGLPYNSVQEI